MSRAIKYVNIRQQCSECVHAYFSDLYYEYTCSTESKDYTLIPISNDGCDICPLFSTEYYKDSEE